MEEDKLASGDMRSSLSLKQNQDVGPKLPVEESECPCRQSCEQRCGGSAGVGGQGIIAIAAVGLQNVRRAVSSCCSPAPSLSAHSGKPMHLSTT